MLPSPRSRILITGASGFLGQSLVDVFLQADYAVRGFDVSPWRLPPRQSLDTMQGDVTDPVMIKEAMAGCDALVIAHMAPNRPEVYATSALPFDINVLGTALLFDAAVAARVKRVILISSIAVVDGQRRPGQMLTRDLPALPTGIYGLTKALQEQTAAYYHSKYGIGVVALRPCYVTDADTLVDKYQRSRPSVNWQFIDRRDVAGAALAGIRATGVASGCYYIHGHPKGADMMETAPTKRDLGWTPRYDFSAYPDDAPAE